MKIYIDDSIAPTLARTIARTGILPGTGDLATLPPEALLCVIARPDGFLRWARQICREDDRRRKKRAATRAKSPARRKRATP